MTNEEALTELTRMYKSVECHDCITSMAFTKAKEALESIDRIKAERNAAIADIKEAARFPCKFCKKEENGCDCYCAYDKWEWRGVRNETD